MAFTVGAIAGKDGGGTTIGGGLLAADIAGGGVGPWFLYNGLVDGLAGSNKAQVTAANALKVDASGAAVPITDNSGSLTVDNGGTFAVQATQSGTWTVQPGNTANTTAWLVTGTGGTFPATQSGTWTVQPGNTANTTPWLTKIHDGTTAATVKAGSTAPAAGDTALVVAISPNSVNANTSDGSGQTTSTHVGAPTIPYDAYSQYETVAASQTDQVMGASGAQYDYLAGVLIIPGTSAAGAVSIKDGNGSSISVFAGGGTTALADLKPFLVPLGLHALASTSAGWKITTGANVTAIGIGKFT